MPDMRLTSPAFAEGQNIPGKYTCEGANLSPPLEFHDIPGEAKSLALVLEDPDAPHGTFIHWTIWNLSPRLQGIGENQEPRETVVGKNS
jgi:Raf kinase inhibitor-like YbhB/YbcL family protein